MDPAGGKDSRLKQLGDGILNMRQVFKDEPGDQTGQDQEK